MLVVDNFHVKIRYKRIYLFSFFHLFLKVLWNLSNCVNEKNVVYGYVLFSYVFQMFRRFRAIKLFECQKNTLGIRNTQYSLAMSVHKQPSVFNTPYTIQSRVKIAQFFSYVYKSCNGFMLSNCVNEKNVYTFSYVFQK